MPSTYTTNGGIELIATGEQSGTWGDTTNDNLNIIDRLTNGVGSISLSGTTHTLTTSDGALSDGQYAVLVFGGTPSGTNTVTISPNTNQHVYIVKNNSGQSVVLTQGSGGNVTVANSKSAIVYADGAGAGAAVVDVTSTFDLGTVTSVGGTGTVNGISLSGTVTSSGNLTLGGTLAISNNDWSGADLAVTNGGTGVSTVPTNGQLLIGNGSGYTVAALTAGTGVSITNGSGSVTINATGTGGTVTSVSGTGTVNGISLSGTVTSSGNLTLGGTFSATVSEISDLTATAAELNLLDGVTATTAELNYLDITTLGTSEASKAVTTDANGVTTFDGGVVEDDTTITSSSGTATINCRDGNVFSHTLSENVTYTFSNPPASGRAFSFTLKVTQDSTARTITWPASVDWPSATAPTISTGNGEVDVFVFFTTDGGTTWYGFTAGQVLS